MNDSKKKMYEQLLQQTAKGTSASLKGRYGPKPPPAPAAPEPVAPADPLEGLDESMLENLVAEAPKPAAPAAVPAIRPDSPMAQAIKAQTAPKPAAPNAAMLSLKDINPVSPSKKAEDDVAELMEEADYDEAGARAEIQRRAIKNEWPDAKLARERAELLESGLTDREAYAELNRRAAAARQKKEDEAPLLEKFMRYFEGSK